MRPILIEAFATPVSSSSVRLKAQLASVCALASSQAEREIARSASPLSSSASKDLSDASRARVRALSAQFVQPSRSPFLFDRQSPARQYLRSISMGADRRAAS